MAFDEQLALRLRRAIEPLGNDFEEKRMFGGIVFMYKNKMSVGIVKDQLCARVIETKYPDLFNEAGVKPMNFTGKDMKDFVYVSQDVLQSEEDLMKWINRGMEHAESKQ